MTKAERLQLIVSLLKISPGIGPADLAGRCRVSERSIFRDLRALQALGFPVYFDRGYRLPAPSFLPPLYLTGEEAMAIRVIAAKGAEREGPMARALLSAQAKLALRLAPATPGPQSQIPLSLPGVPSPSGASGNLVALFHDALARGRKVTIQYARTDRGRSRSRDVLPRHVSLRENGWLLAADDAATGRRLTIPIEQIRDAAVSESRGRRPRTARRHTRTVAALRVKLRLRPPLAILAHDGSLPPGLQIERTDDGAVLLMTEAAGVRELLGWLLSFGPTIEVLEPLALRAELRRVASELSALYEAER
jgi:predicted DNA-binding transcriptional regulator YafY